MDGSLHQFGQLSVRKENSITLLLLGYHMVGYGNILLQDEQNGVNLVIQI